MTASRSIDEPEIPPAEVWARLLAVYGLDKLTKQMLTGEAISRSPSGYGGVTYRFIRASTGRYRLVMEKTEEL